MLTPLLRLRHRRMGLPSVPLIGLDRKGYGNFEITSSAWYCMISIDEVLAARFRLPSFSIMIFLTLPGMKPADVLISITSDSLKWSLKSSFFVTTTPAFLEKLLPI